MVLAKLVTTGKTKLKTVYDPTCGSGSLLLRVAKEVKEVSNFYGQEMNRTTYNLARMNMILHGVHYLKFDIKQEDTLEHPQHIDKQFEAIVANPNQISYRMTQSGAHLGLVFMQLEDKENHRATLQWQIYDGNLKPVYQRSEKLNFGGGSVGLLDFSISPELVCLTTIKHVNSKTVQDAIDYYVVSKERTSVYQGMVLALRNRDASGTWIRYNRDSACFELGGLTAPSSKRIPEHAFHYRIPLQRVDLITGSRFELPAEWVRAWKNDTRDFAFRYFRIPSTTYKFDPNKKGTLAVVYGFEGGYLGKPFQSDLLVLETSPTGLIDSARMERNLVVDKVNSGFGYFNSPTSGNCQSRCRNCDWSRSKIRFASNSYC
jgi:hypothetical protein